MTTSTLTLADFLSARYDEEHAEAQGIVDRDEFGFDVTAIDTWEAYGAHIEIGVGRAFADIEAKRRIVELHGESFSWMDSPTAEPRLICTLCGTDDVTYPCNTLRALALPYVDHPDCRQEWRP